MAQSRPWVTAASGLVAAKKTLVAGVYTATLTVRDDDTGDATARATAYIVVYDPNGGFVTGGGWIPSAAGDCTLSAPCQAASGKANFGFVSKCQRGATTPSGNTEFEFKAGNFRFKSISYEWLVVAGALAQYKGEGAVNGGGSYAFFAHRDRRRSRGRRRDRQVPHQGLGQGIWRGRLRQSA